MPLARTLAANETLRKVALSAYRAAARAMVVYPPPRVLANGIPKGGTHLLGQLLRVLPRMMFSGIHHALNDFSISPGIPPEQIPDVDLARLRRSLRSVNNGQFMTAHFPCHSQLPSLLSELGYKSVLIIRDPRDIVVSHTFYVTGLQRHFLYDRYNKLFTSVDERLLASITGFPADEHGPGQESIAQRLVKYGGWFDVPTAYVCRFEALVGPAGGGTNDAQIAEISSIAAHVGRPLTSERATDVAARVWSPRTATLRKGLIGDWRSHFKPHHIDAFKQVAGRWLVDHGYEKDEDW